MPAWRAVLAGLLILGLGAGLVYVAVAGSGDGGSPVPTLATAPATSQSAATAAPAPATTPTTSTTRAPLVTSSSTNPPAVLVAMQGALTAWGEFAVTGRMRDLGDTFVPGGPQRRLLRDEAPEIRADAPGAPPYEVTAKDVVTISAGPVDVVLRAVVIWSREGEATQSYVWDIHMQHGDDVWQLLTVVGASDPAD